MVDRGATDLGTVELTFAGGIRGRVALRDAAEPSGVLVAVTGGPATAVAADGTWELSRGPAGRRSVVASRPDHLEIQLQGTNFSTATAADGRFSFTDIPAGLYAIRARAEGYEDEIVPNVPVMGGGATYQIPPITLLRGRRLSPDVPPIPPLPGFSPDGARLAYSDAAGRMKAVSTEGGPVMDLDGTGASSLHFTPDGQRVTYFDETGRAIRAVPAGGGAGTQVAAPVRPPSALVRPVYRSATNRWLYADDDPGASPRVGIYSVGLDGSPPTQLGRVPSLSSWVVSDDGAWLAYKAYQPPDWTLALAPAAGGASRVVYGGSSTVLLMLFTPDARRLIFATHTPGGVYAVHACDVDGGTAEVLFTASGLSCCGQSLVISPDSTRALLTTQTPSGAIHSIALASGGSVMLVPNGSVLGFAGRRLVYTDATTGEIRSVLFDGSAPSVQLAPYGQRLWVSDEHLVYGLAANNTTLHAVPAAGPASAALRLSADAGSWGVLGFAGGHLVAVRRDAGGGTDRGLHGRAGRR